MTQSNMIYCGGNYYHGTRSGHFSIGSECNQTLAGLEMPFPKKSFLKALKDTTFLTALAAWLALCVLAGSSIINSFIINL